jgi:hypothetical protein
LRRKKIRKQEDRKKEEEKTPIDEQGSMIRFVAPHYSLALFLLSFCFVLFESEQSEDAKQTFRLL